jgi:hypothetical protein
MEIRPASKDSVMADQASIGDRAAPYQAVDMES